MQRDITMADGTTRTVTFDRLGYRPGATGGMARDVYVNETTGMEYEMHDAEDGTDAVYVAACHEDVGLVTWYRFDSSEDAYLETQYDPTGDDETDGDLAEWARWQ